MSRISDLIEELCPNGVPMRTLKDVCADFIVPMRDRPKRFEGDIPWCRIEDITKHTIGGSKSGLGVTPEVVQEMNLKIMPKGTVIASCSASIGIYAVTETELITNQTFIGLVCGPEIQNRFLLYLLTTKTAELLMASNSGTIAYIPRKKFEELVIPVPPLEVQSEIVQILDTFTELEGELEAELEARKKQFDYYLMRELTFTGDAVSWQRLDSVFEIRTGYTPSKSNNSFWASPEIPWFRMEDIRKSGRKLSQSVQFISETGVKKSGSFKANSLMVCTIATIGEHAIVEVPFVANQQFTILTVRPEFQQLVNPLFVYYYGFKLGQFCRENVNVSGYSSVNMDKFRSFQFPLASLTKQAQIVEHLLALEELCENLDGGLPAEIAARHKQYEFYRDQLLTFEELAS